MVIVLCIFQGITKVQAAKIQPAYVLYTASVYHGNKEITSLAKGTVFKISKIKNERLYFKYNSKDCYVQTKNVLYGRNFENYVKQHPKDFKKKVKVDKSNVVLLDKIRGKKITILEKGSKCMVIQETNSWFKINYKEQKGYVRRADVKASFVIELTNFEKKNKTGGLRNDIVNYAKKFVGNPYVWGGTSLTSGADCSGFVQSVLREFGIKVPRVSYEQCRVGKEVSLNKLKPGDLVFYWRGNRIGHVVMYAGNGKCVQARGSAYGIVITDLYYDKPYCARNVID